MDPILFEARSRQKQIVALIREMVECESPSDDPAAVNRFVDLLADVAPSFARVKTVPGGRFARHVLYEFDLFGKKKQGQILALGHSDTVWPLGTLASMPFRQKNGRLWGPGVLDMKAGIAFFIYAMRILRDLETPVAHKVVMQIVSDEEVGSESSRALTEKNAQRSKAVLVLEPASGLEGKLKTARKGIGGYTVTVRGRATHSGLDFTGGASAVLELARQIVKIAGFTDFERGITVNPGVISGGTRVNVVAAEAGAEVDLRVLRMKDAAALDRKFRALRPADKRCTIEVAGGINRPPLERSPAIVQLFRKAQTLAREMGVSLDETSVGGGSDGNFTAALGVPTLDGLGAVGEGAHALNESILLDRIADRTALLAKLVATL
ncbi:MAG TPA: M20 family metallopeptidase [Bryobacteraceae bacterium]|nr:M20 family metallopeptidase [Bryobacteraceae bacterium]